MSEKKEEGKGISRRKALKYGVAAAVVVGAAAAGGYYYSTMPPTPTPTAIATATATATSSLTGSATAGPGIDYYYDPALKGTKITFLAANVPEITQTVARIPQFEEETGITVNAIVVGEDDVLSKAGLEFAGKSSTYDIFHASGFGSFAYSWLFSGFIEPIEAYVEKTPKGWNKDDIFAAVLSNCSYGGTLYTLPHVTTDYPLFYRTDLMNQPAKTLDDMLADAQKFYKPPSLYGWTSAGTPDIFSFFTWDMFLWACGGRWFDENFHPLLNTDAAYNATKYMIEMAKYAPSFTTTDAVGAATLFAQARIAQATCFGSNWGTTIAAAASKVASTAAYAPHPGLVSEPHMMAGITMCINNFSKQKDAAWSFISWATSPRAQQDMVNIGMGGTIRQSVATSPQTKQVAPFVADQASWLIGAGQAGSGAPKVANAILAPMPRVGDFNAIVVKNLANAIVGTVPYKQAMDNAQQQATSLMKEIGIYK